VQKFGSGKSEETLEQAKSAVKDFDGDQKGSLSFDEFCIMVLPATNQTIRDMAKKRADTPRFRPGPLSSEAV